MTHDPTAPLHVDRGGSASAHRVVLLHGFGQTGRCWGPAAAALADDHEVVAVDLPGHGRSSESRLGVEDAAAAFASVGGSGTYVGYSMGGRFALRLALSHPC